MHRLPVSDISHAAALATTGHALEPPKAYSALSKEHVTFFITGNVGEAGKTLEALKAGKLPADHPFAVCLSGIEALATLNAWLRDPGIPARAVRTSATAILRFMESPPLAAESPGSPGSATVPVAPVPLLPADTLLQHDRHHARRALNGIPYPLLPHHFAAAAIVCGFLPLSLTGPDNAPVLTLTAGSTTIPGLTLSALSAAGGARVPSSPDFLSVPDLPGAPAGEHPFPYALEAIRHLTGLHAAAEIAALNPSLFYKAKQRLSPQTALINRKLLESNLRFANAQGQNLPLRDHLARHLAK